MKKYEKPRVYIERFELSQHIAACAWDMSNLKNVQECSAASDPEHTMISGINAFNPGVAVCIDGPIEFYCYTSSEEGFNIFNS